MMFSGASTANPLLGTWASWLQEHSWIIPQEAQTIAARAEWLGCNDPFCVALYAARKQLTFGATGLHFVSQYDDAPEEKTTSDECKAIRRRATAICNATWTGKELDAENARSRKELEEAIDWAAFHHGDGFAIRVYKGRSVWRLIHRDRIANPPNLSNGQFIRDGFQLFDGAIVGVWVWPPANPLATSATRAPTYVPWQSEDGTPNVIHKVGMRLPGMLRGVSELAPMIVLQRQIGGVLESHVAAKRLQAIMAMIQEAEDPEAYKKACEDGSALTPEAVMNIQGPLNVWIVPPGTKTTLTDTKFNGADLKDFLIICYKVECAVLQISVDVVLCQMGEASFSSGKASLDQAERTGQTLQNNHIEAVSRPIDQAILFDAITDGKLTVPDATPRVVMAGEYSRPPKFSMDRKKDAETVQAYIDAGFSETFAFASIGQNWEDHQEQKKEEAAFRKAQGIDVAQPEPAPAADQNATPAPKKKSFIGKIFGKKAAA